MTLSELLASFENATTMLVTVKDSTDGNPELVKLYASGYAQLLATLLAREVDKVTVQNQASVIVVLKAE